MLSVHMLIMRYSVRLFQPRLADGQLTTLLCAVTLVVKIIATDEKPMKVCITARGERFTAEVESFATEKGLQVIGRIPYDPGVPQRTIEEKSVVEDEQTPAGGAMREIYARFEKELR